MVSRFVSIGIINGTSSTTAADIAGRQTNELADSFLWCRWEGFFNVAAFLIRM